jgi:hypothetical protein
VVVYDALFTAPIGFFLDFGDFLTELVRDRQMVIEIFVAQARRETAHSQEKGEDVPDFDEAEFRRRAAKRRPLRNNDAVQARAYHAGRNWPGAETGYSINVQWWWDGYLWGLQVPLSAKAADGWRPYYGPRKPVWDPLYGMPSPIWRGRRGYLTLFTVNPWQRMRKNPVAQVNGHTQSLPIHWWTAIADFIGYIPTVRRFDDDGLVDLITYRDRFDGKMRIEDIGGKRYRAWFTPEGDLNFEQRDHANFVSANRSLYFFDHDPADEWG